MQRSDLDDDKAWNMIADFFWSEAEFVRLTKVLAQGLEGLNSKLSSSGKVQLTKLKDNLAVVDKFITHENNLRLFTEISEKNLSFISNTDRPLAIEFIKAKFNNNIDDAARAMLHVVNDRVANYELDYIYYNAMRDEIASLEDKFEDKIEIEGRQLGNLTILAVQRYPRYVMMLDGLRKAYEGLNSDDAESVRQQIQYQNETLEQFIQTVEETPKGALFNAYVYLRKYENKNKSDYKDRVENFTLLIDRLSALDPKDGQGVEKLTEILKKNISDFSGFSLSKKYATLLQEIVKALEKNPASLKEEALFFSKNTEGLQESLFIRPSLKGPVLFSPRSFRGLTDLFDYAEKNPDDKVNFGHFNELLTLIITHGPQLNANHIAEFVQAVHKSNDSTDTNKFMLLFDRLAQQVKNNPLVANEFYNQLDRLKEGPNFKTMFPDIYRDLRKENTDIGSFVKITKL